MRADDIVDLLVRRMFEGDEEITFREDGPDRVELSTSRHTYLAGPAPWAIAAAPAVTGALRVLRPAHLDGADRVFGFLWLRERPEPILLNDARAVRELGRLVGHGIPPLAYAEVLAEFYSGHDADSPVVATFCAPSRQRAGLLVSDVAALRARYPLIPSGALQAPRVSISGDEVTLRFCSHDHVLLDSGPAINVRQWQVVTHPDRPARWQRTTVAELVKEPRRDTCEADRAAPATWSRELILDLRGTLNQPALDGLRAALGLHRRGRLTDREDAEFGYRTVTENGEPRLTLRLWRNAEDQWRITIDAHPDAALPENGLTAWGEVATGAAVAAGLTPMAPPLVPPVRLLSALLRQQLRRYDVARLKEELRLSTPVPQNPWDIGHRLLTGRGEPPVTLGLRQPHPDIWVLSVDADPAAVVDPADLDRWFAMMSAGLQVIGGDPTAPVLGDRDQQNRAINRWREEWLARHHLDEGLDLIPPGAQVDPSVRWPTAEQEREYLHGVRRILGQDPQTGRYLDEPA
jgi:hypothetical protein